MAAICHLSGSGEQLGYPQFVLKEPKLVIPLGFDIRSAALPRFIALGTYSCTVGSHTKMG